MPKGVYERSEEQKKKIGESRKRFYDKHGRVVPINQKDSPEAYREYMKIYQRIWREKHKHYYRDLKRKKKEAEDMNKLTEIVSKFNEIQVNCLEVKYRNQCFQRRQNENIG